MKLNHANLPTTDVAALARFFTGYFGFRLAAMRGRDAFAVLVGEDGFVLNLMKAQAADYPDGFHVGFFLDTEADVVAMRDAFAAAGLAAGKVQHLTRGGEATATFYCTAPGGLLVEVATIA